MHYILLIYANEGDQADWVDHSEAERGAVMQQHEDFEQDLRRQGKYRGCGGLHPTGTATTFRRRAGETLVTDGPYVETKEQLGGYYVVDAKDLDDALAMAAKIPIPAEAGVEIRPIADLRLFEGATS